MSWLCIIVRKRTKKSQRLCWNCWVKVLTPNIWRRSGSLKRNGMLDTWRRFGWVLPPPSSSLTLPAPPPDDTDALRDWGSVVTAARASSWQWKMLKRKRTTTRRPRKGIKQEDNRKMKGGAERVGRDKAQGTGHQVNHRRNSVTSASPDIFQNPRAFINQWSFSGRGEEGWEQLFNTCL